MNEVKSPKKPLIYYYSIVLIVLLAMNLLVVPFLQQMRIREVDYGTFMSMTENKEIGQVEVQDNKILFTDKDGKNIYETGRLSEDYELIPRLYDVTEGSVKVSGIDVRKYNLEALRDQVSMVLQKNVLFSGTIYDNIRWGNENATDEEVQNVCKLAQADGFVREFPDGYNTQIVQGGNNVSGGQKQRLCIARALLKKPKILILDDSTSAVDTKTDALIRKAFREEIPNTTKIIIAQRISSIEDADLIIVLENGEISGIGTSEELLKTNAIYREVYESQVKGGEDHE